MSDSVSRISRYIAGCGRLCAATLFASAGAALGSLGLAPVSLAVDFVDVPATAPYAAAVDYLTTEEVISGYADGTFRPDAEVNRAEALKILLLGSGVTSFALPADTFPDVPADAWFAPFVTEAVGRDVVGGYPDGTFQPAQTVNLAEALKMLLAVNRVDLTWYPADAQSYADVESGAWYAAYLYYAQVFDLVDADTRNHVAPSTPLTRAKLAELMYRFATRLDTVCPRVFENTQTTRTNYFAGITLDQPLPSLFFASEVFPLRGRTTEDAKEVTVFFTDATGAQRHFVGGVAADGSFEVPVFFSTPGFVQFAVIAGTSGENVARAIQIAPPSCQPSTVDLPTESATALTATVVDNLPTLTWAAPENALARVVLRQGDLRTTRLVSGGQTQLVFDPARFADWQEDEVAVQVFLATNETGSTSEPRTQWSPPASLTVPATQHHFSTVRDTVSLENLPATYAGEDISLAGSASVPLRDELAYITPDGFVEEIFLTDDSVLAADTPFAVSVPTPDDGTYILELNDTAGLAVLNHPVYPAGTLPLLPDFVDLQRAGEAPTMSNSLNRERALWIRLVNAARNQAGLPNVALDDDLDDLAQNYADYLVARDHFGHTDLEGRTPDDRRRAAGIPLPVGENLAESRSTSHAHQGLMRSAIHLANILNPEWTKVGLGITERGDGRYIFVQQFGQEQLEEDSRAELATEMREGINIHLELSLVADELLTNVAQRWSETLVETGTLAFEAIDTSLENEIRDTGYRGSFSSLLSSASTTQTVVDSVVADMRSDAGFTQIALGIAQNDDGAYVVTVILR